MLTEEKEEEIIKDVMKGENIKADHKKLKCYTVKVEALFQCSRCDHGWSSHMATIVVNLGKRKVNRFKCGQGCRNCVGSWSMPKFTEDRFKEIMDGVTAKYWERKERIDGDDNDDNDNDDDDNDDDNDDDDDDDDDDDNGDDEDDNDYVVVGDKRRGNPRAPHEQSLCQRCKKLGRPCW